MNKNKVTRQQRLAVIDLSIPNNPAIVNVHWNDIMKTPAMQDMAEVINDALDDGWFEDSDDLDY